MPLTIPTFKIFTGPMFAGKSSMLLLELERFKYQHKKIMIFKPKCDDRYSEEEIVTHGGWKTMARVVENGADVLEFLAEMQTSPDVIAVDEAFMIPGIAEALIFLYRNGFHVIVSSLDMSSSGKTFKEVEKMLPWATEVKKCSAVCEVCGKDAFFTHKKQNLTEEEIQVGGSDLYSPRCFRCHPFIWQREQE